MDNLFPNVGVVLHEDGEAFCWVHVLEPFMNDFKITRHVMQASIALCNLFRISRGRKNPTLTQLSFNAVEIFDLLKERIKEPLDEYKAGTIDFQALLSEFKTMLCKVCNIELLPVDLKAYWVQNYEGVDLSTLTTPQARVARLIYRYSH